jgi:hypothetical protein
VGETAPVLEANGRGGAIDAEVVIASKSRSGDEKTAPAQFD